MDCPTCAKVWLQKIIGYKNLKEENKSVRKTKTVHRFVDYLQKNNSGAASQTCTDDPVGSELLNQQLHVGVMMGVELPAWDPQMEAQPWRMAVTASVPLDVLRFFQSVTLPVKRTEIDKTPMVWELFMVLQGFCESTHEEQTIKPYD